MTMTWDADYTFTGCVGFEGEFWPRSSARASASSTTSSRLERL